MVLRYNSSIKDLLPSNFKFGIFFSFIFICLSFYFYFFDNNYIISLVAVSFSLIFFSVSFIRPNLLTPFNYIWFLIGLFLGKVISPVIIGFIFFLIISPVAFITRLFGRDPLNIKDLRQKHTYWQDLNSKVIEGKSFNQQF